MPRRHEAAQIHQGSGMGQRVMSKLSEKFAYGLVSARSGQSNLKRALKEEWLALRTAEQDRAHLATIV